VHEVDTYSAEFFDLTPLCF